MNASIVEPAKARATPYVEEAKARATPYVAEAKARATPYVAPYIAKGFDTKDAVMSDVRPPQPSPSPAPTFTRTPIITQPKPER